MILVLFILLLIIAVLCMVVAVTDDRPVVRKVYTGFATFFWIMLLSSLVEML